VVAGVYLNDNVPAIRIAVGALHPYSPGQVSLNSTNPSQPPPVEHTLLSDRRDVGALIDAVQRGREIIGAQAFAPHVVEEHALALPCILRSSRSSSYAAPPVVGAACRHELWLHPVLIFASVFRRGGRGVAPSRVGSCSSRSGRAAGPLCVVTPCRRCTVTACPHGWCHICARAAGEIVLKLYFEPLHYVPPSCGLLSEAPC
jgi:GMC oxidoreductase